MTFEEFKNDPPMKLKVYDYGRGKIIVVKLNDDKEKYITGNMGNSNRKVYHYWSMENVYNAALEWKGEEPLYVNEIETRVIGKVFSKKSKTA